MVDPAEPVGSPMPKNQVDPERLLEFADWMGLDEEVAEARADALARRLEQRVVRVLELAGLPVRPTPEQSGVVIQRCGTLDESEKYLNGSVAVSWASSTELSDLCEGVDVDKDISHLADTTYDAMLPALAAILQAGGCHTLIHSQRGEVVITGLSPLSGANPLHLP